MAALDVRHLFWNQHLTCYLELINHAKLIIEMCYSPTFGLSMHHPLDAHSRGKVEVKSWSSACSAGPSWSQVGYTILPMAR